MFDHSARRRRLHAWLRADTGSATAEYAIATLATVGRLGHRSN
jgi:hypothetical protein